MGAKVRWVFVGLTWIDPVSFICKAFRVYSKVQLTLHQSRRLSEEMGAKIRWVLTLPASSGFILRFRGLAVFPKTEKVQITLYQDRGNVDMEIRVFIPPDRPDHYRMIVRVKPGEVRNVLTRKLCDLEEYLGFGSKTDNHIFLMVFMDGTYTGVTLLPWEVKTYAKIIGYYYVGDCGLVLKGIRFTFASFFRIDCHNFAIERKSKGKRYSSTNT